MSLLVPLDLEVGAHLTRAQAAESIKVAGKFAERLEREGATRAARAIRLVQHWIGLMPPTDKRRRNYCARRAGEELALARHLIAKHL